MIPCKVGEKITTCKQCNRTNDFVKGGYYWQTLTPDGMLNQWVTVLVLTHVPIVVRANRTINKCVVTNLHLEGLC